MSCLWPRQVPWTLRRCNMANPYAGQVALNLNGDGHLLKLTLGSLVELEQLLEADSLVALVERFETGRYRAKDILVLLFCGLKGGSWDGSLVDLADADIEGGTQYAAQVAARLLVVSFSLPQGDA